MYTMGKLPSLSHHFIHGTITRTGIQVVLYSHVFNTNVFVFFYLKTLMFLFEWAAMEIKLCQRFFCVIPAIPNVFVRNIYIHRMLYVCIYRYMYIYQCVCQYISIFISVYVYMYICIYTYMCIYILHTCTLFTLFGVERLFLGFYCMYRKDVFRKDVRKYEEKDMLKDLCKYINHFV